MEQAIEDLLRTAHRHLSRNEVAEAEAACQRALAQRPNNPDGLMLAAAIAARGGRFDRAEHLLGRVLQKDTRSIPALYLLGEVQRRSGQPRKALRQMMRAMQHEFGLPPTANDIAFWRLLVDGVARTAPVQAFMHRSEEFAAFGTALEAAGVFAEHAQNACEYLAAVDMRACPAAEATNRLNALLGLAAFRKGSSPDWNRRLFESAVLPWMKRALAAQQLDAGLMLEVAVLNEYVSQNETETHFAGCVRLWTDEMRLAGRRFATGLPPLPRRAPAAVPKVAFFVHQLSALAHVRLLLDVLEGHARLPEPLLSPLIVCLRRSMNPLIIERIRQLGIEVFEMADSELRSAGAAEVRAIRDAVAARGVDAIVWVSLVPMMPFAFSVRIAPVQIWWAMKYHSLEFPEIDGYLTGGSVAGGTRRIGEREWRAGPIAAEDWFAPELAEEAVKVRAGYSRHRILYGCFGREEKLNSAPFLDAVTAILQAVPDAGFLWTGRQRHPAIQAKLESAGVAERCHFIGWVNTRLYAQVIDVFLDSFPFPCGYTLYESMAAANPAVLYASAEAMETGARSMIEPLLIGQQGSQQDRDMARAIFQPDSGTDLYLCAHDRDKYVAHAVRLGTEDALRQQVGKAGQAFIERFMSDRKRLGHIYCEHISAIIRETSQRNS